ncbi:hypothetical protein OSTOST_24395, partial [Ostertagia ostertagi]
MNLYVAHRGTISDSCLHHVVDFMVRGSPDSLSDALASAVCKPRCQDIKIPSEAYSRAGKTDYVLPIEDPFGLPPDNPVKGTNIIKRMISKEQLTESYVRNPLVKLAFSSLKTAQRDALVYDLLSIQPCNPT